MFSVQGSGLDSYSKNKQTNNKQIKPPDIFQKATNRRQSGAGVGGDVSVGKETISSSVSLLGGINRKD